MPWITKEPRAQLAGVQTNTIAAHVQRIKAAPEDAPGLPKNANCVALVSLVCRDRFRDLRFHRLKVEARTLLHRREIDSSLRDLLYLLLRVLESPELEGEPVVERQRALRAVRQIGALVGIKSEIGKDRPIDFHRTTQPAAGLISKAVLEIVDPQRTHRALGEIQNLVPLRWPLSGDQIRLVVAV